MALAFSVALLASGAVLAQEKLTPAQPDKLTEVEQLKLQLLQEKQKRLRAEFNAAMLQCQAQPDVRAIMNENDQVSKDISALIDAHKEDKK